VTEGEQISLDFQLESFYYYYSTLEIRGGHMDVNKALRELHEEKRRLDLTIAALEARLKTSHAPARRRGRKSMSPEERLEVSRRMLKYWEARRASAATLEPEQPRAAAAANGALSA
jgi:hypothetical protein